MLLKQGDRVGLSACSNTPVEWDKVQIDTLCTRLQEVGLVPVCSPCLRYEGGPFSATPKERANSLMHFFLDDSIRAIFDVSGGDLANQMLEYLDFSLIRNHPKPFFGYSDLTVLINALYRKAGLPCVLWQARNLADSDAKEQLQRFCASLLEQGDSLFRFSVRPLQGGALHGTVVGGNVRCLLKLAGTPYFPELSGNILFLESFGGGPALIASLFTQLRQLDAFKKVKGVLLGTFSQMEREELQPDVVSLLLAAADNPALPIFKTAQIGHEPDSRALLIGGTLHLSGEEGVSEFNHKTK